MNDLKNKPKFYKFFFHLIKFFYPKYKVEILSPLKENSGVFVANHAQAHGPLSTTIYFPRKRKTWTIGEMCNKDEIIDFVMEDWWRNKKCQWFYKLISKIIIRPIVTPLMQNADTISVYKDSRLRRTMKDTLNALKNNEDIIIFPEHREKYNKYINKFQEHFVDVVSLYARSENELYFYPTYICPSLKKIIIGEAILFNSNEDINIERIRIVKELQKAITKIAESLPRHKIVPYDNISKRKMIYSKEKQKKD